MSAIRDAKVYKASSREWAYSTWSGSRVRVTANIVEFTPTHVVWRDGEGRVVLAEEARQVNTLTEVEIDRQASADRRLKTQEDRSTPAARMAEAWDRGHFYCAAEQGDRRCVNPYTTEGGRS